MDLANSMSGDKRTSDDAPPSADRLWSMSAIGVVSKVDGSHGVGAGVAVVTLMPIGVYGSRVRPGVGDELRLEFKLTCDICTP